VTNDYQATLGRKLESARERHELGSQAGDVICPVPGARRPLGTKQPSRLSASVVRWRFFAGRNLTGTSPALDN
jgi:hypothetical protein